MNKKDARKYALAQRGSLVKGDRFNFIVNELKEVIKKYNNIGIYYPIGSEIDITNIMNIYPNK